MDKTIHYKFYGTGNGSYRLVILLLFAIFISCKKEPEIKLLFTGDILLSRNVKEEYTARKTFPWEELQREFNSTDLVIGNLEGAVGNVSEQINSLSESPVFPIDSNDIYMLSKAGFNIVSIENNHVFDLGSKGKNRTIAALLKNNINPVYFENSPSFITVKDVVFSIIAVNNVLNRDSSKNIIPSIELGQKIKLAKSLSNIVIMTIHWGSELLEWPNKQQYDAAKWMINNGADIIIGTHPHVIQKPEIIDGKPVFFSLGNHLFDQKYPETKEGLIAEITIKKGKVFCSGIITHTVKNSFYPEITGIHDFNLKPFRYSSELFKSGGITLKPFSISDEKDSKLILQAFKDGKHIWNSHPMSLISISSNKLDNNEEYLFTLEKYYSSIDKEINPRPYIYRIDNLGLLAKWRGSALAWPMLDAQILPENEKILCALHRGDSYINPDNSNQNKRIAAYEWNGFGFTVVNDSTTCNACKRTYE